MYKNYIKVFIFQVTKVRKKLVVLVHFNRFPALEKVKNINLWFIISKECQNYSTYLHIYTMYTVQYTGSIGSHHVQDAFHI